METKIIFKEVEFQKLSLRANDLIFFYLPKETWSDDEVHQFTQNLRRITSAPKEIHWVILRKRPEDFKIEVVRGGKDD